ncbi:hypothetical protein SEA_THIMANN_62 [Gordonia phage Thimann]|nr:hypothetical protein SEA_THIMANN_62 [Gordonia phage Thimann]
MSDDVRADARRLREGITPGPWFVDVVPKGDGRIFVGNRADGREHGLWEIVYANGDDLGDLKEEAARKEVANAEFIAAAPTLVDRLLAELDRADDVTRRRLDAALLQQVRARIDLAETWSRYLVPDHDGALIDADNVDTLLEDLTRMVAGGA